MGCSCQPQVNHSQLSSKYTQYLKICTFIFVGFSLLKAFMISSNNLLNDILLAVILYALITQLSYLMGFFAIFFIMFDFIFELLAFFQILQNICFGFPVLFPVFIIRFLNIIIYFALLCLSFLCSREYKALFVEQKNGGVFEEYQMFTDDFNNMSRARNPSDVTYQKLNNNDNEPKGYKPFSGQGQTWG